VSGPLGIRCSRRPEGRIPHSSCISLSRVRVLRFRERKGWVDLVREMQRQSPRLPAKSQLPGRFPTARAPRRRRRIISGRAGDSEWLLSLAHALKASSDRVEAVPDGRGQSTARIFLTCSPSLAGPAIGRLGADASGRLSSGDPGDSGRPDFSVRARARLSLENLCGLRNETPVGPRGFAVRDPVFSSRS
jgi:hypothetical protein